MKTITALALGAMFTVTAGFADAAPRGKTYMPNYGYERHDRDYRPAPRRHQTIEVKAQLRLRELGYYRGAIDGDFGRGSTRALVRFQRDHRLPISARLDRRTLRSLRIL